MTDWLVVAPELFPCPRCRGSMRPERRGMHNIRVIPECELLCYYRCEECAYLFGVDAAFLLPVWPVETGFVVRQDGTQEAASPPPWLIAERRQVMAEWRPARRRMIIRRAAGRRSATLAVSA